LIALIPNGPERSKVIDSFVEFLEQNSEQTRTRVEWLLMVNRLLSGAAAADDRKEVMQAFLNSRDSALSVYAHLELVNPRQL
jgi:hypothetical protein